MLDLLKLFTSELLFTLIVPGLFAGVGLLILGNFLPTAFVQYKIPALLTGIALCILFTFEAGRYNEFSAHSIEVAQQNALIAELKAKSGEVTVETVTKYVDKIKYVDRWKEVKVDDFVPKEADAKCVIDTSTAANIRMLYDRSNQGQLPTTTGTVDVGTTATH